MLSDIKSMDDIFTPKRLLALITMALIMFTLSHFARKRKAKHTDWVFCIIGSIIILLLLILICINIIIEIT